AQGALRQAQLPSQNGGFTPASCAGRMSGCTGRERDAYL
ncbi:hypothetical protein A2U01_0091578, partial [Trifolium medium]|nr:hypothetical protein [Trifolium medium]